MYPRRAAAPQLLQGRDGPHEPERGDCGDGAPRLFQTLVSSHVGLPGAEERLREMGLDCLASAFEPAPSRLVTSWLIQHAISIGKRAAPCRESRSGTASRHSLNGIDSPQQGKRWPQVPTKDRSSSLSRPSTSQQRQKSMSSNGVTSTTGLYEPVAPPRYEVSETSHGVYALIAATIMVAISGLAVFVKVHMATTTFRRLRRDDFALIAAWVSSTCTCRSRLVVTADADHRLADLRTRVHDHSVPECATRIGTSR